MLELEFLLFDGGVEYFSLLLVLALAGRHVEPSPEGGLVHGQAEPPPYHLEERFRFSLSDHEEEVFQLVDCYLPVGAEDLEQVGHVLVVKSHCPAEGLAVEQTLNLVLDHLVELLLEGKGNVLVFARQLPLVLGEQAELLEVDLALPSPPFQE